MREHSLRAVELQGRLGNQLFQFAMMKAQLQDDGPVLVESIAASDHPLRLALRDGQYRRLTSRESLKLRRPPSLDGRTRPYLQSALGRVPDPLQHLTLGRAIYTEPHWWAFDPDVARQSGPVLLRGYFQNEQYFQDEAQRVVSSLNPASAAMSEQMRSVTALGRSRESVAIVVRAGLDYEQLQWAVRLKWYLEAAQRACATLADPGFMVFSDVPLCAEAVAVSLRDLGPAHAVLGLSPLDQLHMMSTADHVVTGPTTFGWWGAWLGDAARGFGPRTVVTPDPWLEVGCETPSPRWTSIPYAYGFDHPREPLP